jgi:hypothetical protein
MSNIDDPAPWPGKRISFPKFAADIMRRRAELGGDIDVPRNDGNRRTASKRALLEAIEATGKKW